MATSDDVQGGMHTVDEGPFAGWHTWVGSPFETLIGPFYRRTDDDGTVTGAFAPQDKNTNHASGRVLRETKSMVFVQGQLERTANRSWRSPPCRRNSLGVDRRRLTAYAPGHGPSANSVTAPCHS
jgi:hypothetical protein